MVNSLLSLLYGYLFSKTLVTYPEGFRYMCLMKYDNESRSIESMAEASHPDGWGVRRGSGQVMRRPAGTG